MAANSLYLLVIIGFAAKDQRVQPYYGFIRAFGGMPMSSIVGTEIPSAKARFGVSLRWNE
jgi:hypothetical protein